MWDSCHCQCHTQGTARDARVFHHAWNESLPISHWESQSRIHYLSSLSGHMLQWFESLRYQDGTIINSLSPFFSHLKEVFSRSVGNMLNREQLLCLHQGKKRVLLITQLSSVPWQLRANGTRQHYVLLIAVDFTLAYGCSQWDVMIPWGSALHPWPFGKLQLGNTTSLGSVLTRWKCTNHILLPRNINAVFNPNSAILPTFSRKVSCLASSNHGAFHPPSISSEFSTSYASDCWMTHFMYIALFSNPKQFKNKNVKTIDKTKQK